MHRHELTDAEWSIIQPLLPNKPRVDDRRDLAAEPRRFGYRRLHLLLARAFGLRPEKWPSLK